MAKDKRDMKLVYVGDSNWDLYYDKGLNCIFAMAKVEGCKDSIFGSLRYTRNYLQKEIESKSSREARLTRFGFAVLDGNFECLKETI